MKQIRSFFQLTQCTGCLKSAQKVLRQLSKWLYISGELLKAQQLYNSGFFSPLVRSSRASLPPSLLSVSSLGTPGHQGLLSPRTVPESRLSEFKYQPITFQLILI
jgi:hypothetical protein